MWYACVVCKCGQLGISITTPIPISLNFAAAPPRGQAPQNEIRAEAGHANLFETHALDQQVTQISND